MPAQTDMTEDQAIDQLKKLPRDRQILVLKGLPEAKKQDILKRMKGNVSPSFWSNPSQFLARRSQEMGAEAQRQQGMAVGPESKGRPFLVRMGHSFLSYAPSTAEVIDKFASGLVGPEGWKNAAALLVSKLSPTATAAFFANEGGKTAYEAIQKGSTDPENVQNLLLGLATVTGSVAGAGEAAPGEAARPATTKIAEGGKKIAKATELVRRGAQIVAGVGPERTTAPLVEKFKESKTAAEAKQTEANTAADEANRAAAEKYQTAKREAFQADEEAKAQHALETEEVNARNQAQQDMQTQRGTLARTINDGSKEVGEGIQGLEKKVRAEGNDKYNAVKTAVAKDPGVPAADVAQAVTHAEQNILKGSAESIREFRDILRRNEEGPEVDALRQDVMSGQGMSGEYRNLTEERKNLVDEIAEKYGGGKVESQTIAFDDLKGYSTEIGAKLSRGKMGGPGRIPGDVYKALQYVKDALDKQKAVVAERNGVGPQLKEADAFWSEFMGTFFDKPSAVAETLSRVGKLDPEYYTEPFITGKAAKRGIDSLRKYDPAIADRVEQLRKQNEEFQGLPEKAKLAEPPEAPAPHKLPEKPEFKAPKKIDQPETPTIADVQKEKRSELSKSAREVGRLSKYDAAILASSVIGPFYGHWSTLLIDPALIAARKGIGKILDRPSVVKWLEKPSPEDLRILSEVNPEVRAEVQKNMADFIKQEEAHGNHITLSREIGRWLGEKGAGLVKRGQEIMKGEEGSLGMPQFDWSKTSSVGAGEADAFAAAKRELFPEKRDLSNKEIAEVSRRAAEITQEKKSATAAHQGEDAVEEARRRGPGEAPKGKNVPALRRQVESLRAKLDAETEAGDSNRWRTREKLLDAEAELASIEK